MEENKRVNYYMDLLKSNGVGKWNPNTKHQDIFDTVVNPHFKNSTGSRFICICNTSIDAHIVEAKQDAKVILEDKEYTVLTPYEKTKALNFPCPENGCAHYMRLQEIVSAEPFEGELDFEF